MYEENPENFHARLVTGDETWIHHWDQETKQESMQWKHPGSPPPKEVQNPTFSWQSYGHCVLGFEGCADGTRL